MWSGLTASHNWQKAIALGSAAHGAGAASSDVIQRAIASNDAMVPEPKRKRERERVAESKR